MAKETCTNCYIKLPGAVSFCPNCERPTRHATDAQMLDWDLKQWRAHTGRSESVQQGANGARVAATAVTAVASMAPPVLIAQPMKVEKAGLTEAQASNEAPNGTNGRHKPRIAIRKPRLPRRTPKPEPDVVIDLDADHEFAYRACATCEATDWIVRTTRNDDETWNYWCVRCSRAFKTEIKLRYAVKPFLSAGIVVGGLTAASMLMLR